MYQTVYIPKYTIYMCVCVYREFLEFFTLIHTIIVAAGDYIIYIYTNGATYKNMYTLI